MVYESGAGHRARPLLQRAHRGRAGVRARRSRSRGRTATIFDVLRATEYVVPGAGDPQLPHRDARGARSSTRSATTPPMGGMVLRRQPGRGRRGRPALGARRCSTATRRSRSPASPPPCSTIPRTAWRGSRTSSHQHGARLEAGEIILAGSFTRPDVGASGRHRARRLRTDGDHRMPLRLSAHLPRAHRAVRPSARGHVGVLRVAARRGDLRRRGPRLAADRHGALPERPRIHAGAAAGRRRLPGHARSCGRPSATS